MVEPFKSYYAILAQSAVRATKIIFYVWETVLWRDLISAAASCAPKERPATAHMRLLHTDCTFRPPRRQHYNDSAVYQTALTIQTTHCLHTVFMKQYFNCNLLDTNKLLPYFVYLMAFGVYIRLLPVNSSVHICSFHTLLWAENSHMWTESSYLRKILKEN